MQASPQEMSVPPDSSPEGQLHCHLASTTPGKLGVRVSEAVLSARETQLHGAGCAQAGSLIVEELRKYRHPVLVYLPPGSELRGGAWVVIDSQINTAAIEMFADPTATGLAPCHPENHLKPHSELPCFRQPHSMKKAAWPRPRSSSLVLAADGLQNRLQDTLERTMVGRLPVCNLRQHCFVYDR